MNTKTITSPRIAVMLLAATAIALAPEAFAQVNTTGLTSSVTQKLAVVYEVLRAGGILGASISALMLAYKAMFVENFKLMPDGKGLMIGGVIFGAAGAIGQVFV